MPLGDKQVLASQVAAGNSDYVIPGAVSLQLKAVQALFTDNGAGSDWLPAVVAISDSGHVFWRAVDQGVKVTAGSDAEVSWFPGVKHAATTAATGVQAAYAIASLSVSNFGDTGVSVPNNTTTAIRFPHWQRSDTAPFTFTPGLTYTDALRLRDSIYIYVCHSSLRWHLAGFNQYSSLIGPSPVQSGSSLLGALDNHGETPANQFSAGDLFSGSPLWGTDTKSFISDTPPQDVTLTAFQTSGIAQVIDDANLLCIAYTF